MASPFPASARIAAIRRLRQGTVAEPPVVGQGEHGRPIFLRVLVDGGDPEVGHRPGGALGAFDENVIPPFILAQKP